MTYKSYRQMAEDERRQSAKYYRWARAGLRRADQYDQMAASADEAADWWQRRAGTSADYDGDAAENAASRRRAAEQMRSLAEHDREMAPHYRKMARDYAGRARRYQRRHDELAGDYRADAPGGRYDYYAHTTGE